MLNTYVNELFGRRNMNKIILSASLLMGFGVSSYAALLDLGNGVIYDSEQNISWSKDINPLLTACNATSGVGVAMWDTFSSLQQLLNSDFSSGRTPEEICTGSTILFQPARLNRYEAQVWIVALNVNDYLGYSDWRRPVADEICGASLNCDERKVSELGHLHYATDPDGLGNVSIVQGCENNTPHGCFINKGPFEHTKAPFEATGSHYRYWAQTSAPPIGGEDRTWAFNMKRGSQEAVFNTVTNVAVWPVRGGLLPLPATGGGDCNNDGNVDIQDVICTINKVLAGP